MVVATDAQGHVAPREGRSRGTAFNSSRNWLQTCNQAAEQGGTAERQSSGSRTCLGRETSAVFALRR
jgi:hypothetical protein